VTRKEWLVYYRAGEEEDLFVVSGVSSEKSSKLGLYFIAVLFIKCVSIPLHSQSPQNVEIILKADFIFTQVCALGITFLGLLIQREVLYDCIKHVFEVSEISDLSVGLMDKRRGAVALLM
jgi:hypothetical protein